MTTPSLFEASWTRKYPQFNLLLAVFLLLLRGQMTSNPGLAHISIGANIGKFELQYHTVRTCTWGSDLIPICWHSSWFLS